MAAASISDQDQFNCPVCLELLKDPVTLHCGHSYCKVCIISFWDKEVQKKVYSCPQCRETFTPRPVLCRNNMLAEVVEKLKKNKLQAASAAHHYAGPGDVDCDSCNGRKRKATNSCLVCLASYCEDHLKPHYQSPAFKKHKLVEACVDLQKKICSQHNKVMEIYCQTDQSFICYLCTLDKHRGHDTVSAKAERTEKQNKLREEQLKSQQKVQEKQKKVQELKQTVDIIKKRSQEAVDDNEKIFNEMISSLVKRRSEVKEMIRVQEKAELSRAEQHLKHLEQEITDLQRRVSDLEQLSHTPDHIHFLQSFPSLCVSPGCDDSPSFTVNQHLSFDGVRKSVSDLKKRVEEICQEEFNKIRPQAAVVQRTLPSHMTSRKECLQYFCYLTLDPNTAHPFLVLSENHREVMWSETKQQYSDHPERFDSWVQVLCKESVCGRRYWEVDWNSENLVYISVSYKEISRKGQGDESVFGRNSQSWSLLCYSSSVSFSHNGVKTELRGPAASRIGVYVDHSAGTLFFYSISKRLRLLHRVQTTFTQPLYAGFRIGFKSAVKFCELK
ncbi:tripartite motif-containing protein 16-like [Silurus meridionalis]|uniref:tripartite motif-containing protein 16-like n=1 Tax=Silurus meridionalis TaxID=175797 RepID=UPI001EEA78BC|nr:tripartite motif-containing protein 16-like [Silurus meridionalis]